MQTSYYREKLNEQYLLAQKVMPGGVNSSVRYNNAIGLPFYISHAKGGILYDLSGRPVIDMCCAHGAGLLGNGNPLIDEAVRIASSIGYCNSMETVYHEQLAREVCDVIPCSDKVRFVNSGTEATLHLIRLCRAVTGRKKIIRMEGHFHGYHECIYIGGKPPKEKLADNREHPYIESPGILDEYALPIIPIPFNDVDQLNKALEKHGKETALLILEPICYNTGGMKPLPGYLEYLREVTKREGILLFFDEVQSSFKKSPGGAQQDFGVVPDVCTIGKAFGGGMPLSAMCGRADIMDELQPTGNTQHSGTFNAPLINVLAGLQFMKEIKKPEFYAGLEALGNRLYSGLQNIIDKYDLNMCLTHHGARFNIVLGRKDTPVRYEDTFTHDKNVMLNFVGKCIDQGVYFHDYGGGPAHHGFSASHTFEDIDKVLYVVENVLMTMHGEKML